MDPRTAGAATEPVVRSGTLPLLAGYWSFGQFWGSWGFAISAAGPAAFGRVEEATDDPTSAITAVAMIGYTGFVWSPPLLGWIAQVADLRAAMAAIVLATVGITATGLVRTGRRA